MIQGADHYIVVVVDEVDVTTRLAHCKDKTGASVPVSFRQSAAGVLAVPKSQEQWLAKRLGYAWYFEARLDSIDEHEWVAGNMASGDVRITGDAIHTRATTLNVNGLGWGPTVCDWQFSGSTFATFALSYTPANIESIQPFLNGALVSPANWVYIAPRTLFFPTALASGTLVIYYQTTDVTSRDAATVMGSSRISATLATT